MDSLLSIISSQRERFRAKNQELEGVSVLGMGLGGCRASARAGCSADLQGILYQPLGARGKHILP